MNMIDSVEQAIGNTPLLSCKRFCEGMGVSAKLIVKLEGQNPAGSAKDRVAKQMLLDAEAKGLIRPGATIIEPTSGNTGIGLASLAAAKGYQAIFVMPDTMSVERQMLLKAYGAKIVLTDGKEGMAGSIREAKRLHEITPNSFLPDQFCNPSNSKAHYLTTGPEIWQDTDGEIDAFVSAVGTGGTITGTGRYLKEQKRKIHIVAVEPKGSPVLSGGKAGPHGIQGIGAGFIPEVLDTAVYDEILCITEEEAYDCARSFARLEGVLVGISSGSALAAAVKIGKRKEFFGKSIVVLCADSGERYLSTELYR